MTNHRDRIASIIKGALIFDSLDDCRLDAVVNIADFQTQPADRMLYTTDRPSKGLYVIGSGKVKVFQLSSEGKEFILHILGKGTTFAEAGALGQFGCPASAVTMERSELVLLPADKLMKVIESDGRLSIEFMKGMAAVMCGLMHTLQNVVLRDSLGRVSGYLLSLVDGASVPVKVHFPIKKRDVASFLALTPETLSRTLARLVELGAIKHDEGSDLELVSVNMLEGLAES